MGVACTTYSGLSLDEPGSGDAGGTAGVRASNVTGTADSNAGGLSSVADAGDSGLGQSGMPALDTTSYGGAGVSSTSIGAASGNGGSGGGGSGGGGSGNGGDGNAGSESASGGSGGGAADGATGSSAASGGTGSGGFGGAATGGSTASGGTAGVGGSGGVSAGGTSSQSASKFRYVRLVALTSQNGYPFTAIAEIELLGTGRQIIDSSGWTASADSQETVDETAPASQAIDGDTDTFWHSEWGEYDAPLPHYLQIDLGVAREITGFVYTPRQDGRDNGHILDWELYLSNSASDPGMVVHAGSFSMGWSVQTVYLP